MGYLLPSMAKSVVEEKHCHERTGGNRKQPASNLDLASDEPEEQEERRATQRREAQHS